MPSIYLVANEVLFTSYGHIQFVYDPDGTFDTGDEKEIEVQSSSFGFGDWDVSPVQDLDIPFGADTAMVQLSVPTGRDVSDIWDLLGNVRDFFAAQTIDYRLGLTGSLEGQNSNSYITTLAHVVGLDIGSAVATLLASPDIGSFPGIARNVLFDHVATDDTALAPVALTLAGTDGVDVIAGGNGADTLSGENGNDTLYGYGDSDLLSGGGGRDTVLGGDGNDTLNGNGGRDQVQGGAGDDDLYGQGQNDRLIGGAGNDTVWGGNGSDRLVGNGGNDTLWGGKDADTLLGGGGQDALSGQNGGDLLNGMKGDDVMSGGGGADVFVFDGSVNEGQDEITDFTIGKDIIRVVGLEFSDITIGGGANAVLSLDGKTEITLYGVAERDIGASDFDFSFV